MAIVIEVLGSNKRVQDRYFFNHGDISFGRGYDNDVVIDDVHVDAEHAILRLTDENTLLLVDNNSLNGIRDKRNKLFGSYVELTSGDRLLLGKTSIRIVDTEHPVPAAVTLKVDGFLQSLFNNLYVGLALFVLFLFSQAYETYLDTIADLKFKDLFNNSILITAVTFGTAVFLSLIGKVVRREWRFNFHLIVCSGLLVSIGLLSWCLNLILFNYDLGFAKWAIDGVIFGAWGLLFLWGVSRSVFLLKPLHMKLFSVGIVSLLVFFSISDELFVNPDKFISTPVYTKLFRPAIFRVRTPITEEEFFSNAQVIFDIPVDVE